MIAPSSCWLHPGVVLGRSEIEGRGLFAAQPIEVGELVSRLGGSIVTDAELAVRFGQQASDPTVGYIDTITVGEGLHLLMPVGRANHCGNHSCDPNLWWIDAFTLVARRDIASGEELTNDYGTSTAVSSFRMQCRCGSPLCRTFITGDDWRNCELRSRYGQYWVPELLRLQAQSAEGRIQATAEP
ncbi:MAG TPA: SET domain-containing protein [Candidatus Saccharimonadales bacterium]|nr:SET domain-containing protein [Candidatus Saccharimonadales bacterium]